MATNDTDAAWGLTDKRQGRGSTDSPIANASEATFVDVAALDTYLLANGYTQAVLDHMTRNDKVYATRQKADAPGTFRG